MHLSTTARPVFCRLAGSWRFQFAGDGYLVLGYINAIFRDAAFSVAKVHFGRVHVLQPVVFSFSGHVEEEALYFDGLTFFEERLNEIGSEVIKVFHELVALGEFLLFGREI